MKVSAISLKKALRELIEARSGYFDSSEINILNTYSLNQGLLSFYYVKNPFSLGAVLLNKENLKDMLWRTSNPIWKTSEDIHPLKITKNKKDIIFSFRLKKIMHTVKFSLTDIFRLRSKPILATLKKTEKNPILKPNAQNNWEASAVFNAAALYLDNKVHFIYRAIMGSGESVFGYASSSDGIHVEERSRTPIYVANNIVDWRKISHSPMLSRYISGGSWSGCEDPRLTRIGDTIFMTYTAINGTSLPHMMVTSISVNNFIQKNWQWTAPISMSSPYEIHKNWVIFPEKMNGKYAILHSLTPNILIEYVDTLGDRPVCIRSHYDSSRKNINWDNWIRGVGPPPIKIDEGWLVLYHGMDWRDPNKYKLGAMILGYDDPTQVLYRSAHPILEPTESYENSGYKTGVVYACGAVVIGKTLFVYYGAGDTVLCAASADLKQLINQIKDSQMPILNFNSKEYHV